MAVFKCKMCGGNLEVSDGMTVCECEYCGTKQTLPKSSDEQQLNLINRANHFRQQCEFDKAMEIYERMLQRDDSDAEIYWSIVLCKYGIEYVDDPLSKKKIPTCHRAQYTLITQDADFLEALSHADVLQKEVYQREAEYIANVQKGILEISNKEEPFDVFICYKETGEDGKRTQDSVLAQDLYYQLTQEGFKVFFSRITLEDKLGSAYEPYIFAALNSSKVMVVVGTKPEYFNAVWVKNEWSRYLLLMKEDRTKTLIPAYKGMDPYDLPEALSMFQAQDMSKLGFMQDLIRGIKKIAGSGSDNAPKSSNTVSSANSKADNLIKRGFMSLEDGDMQKAGSYFEQALNEDAEEARAYVGLLLVELDLRSEADLETVSEPLDTRNNFKKAMRFADDKLRERLSGYNEAIRNREFDNTYNRAKAQLDNSHSFEEVRAGVNSLLQVKGWRDANDILYNIACKYSEGTVLKNLNFAVNVLKEIIDWKDSKDIIYQIGTRFEDETDPEKLNFCVSALETISEMDGVSAKIDEIKSAISDIEARAAEKKKRNYDAKIGKWRSDFADGLVKIDFEHHAWTYNDCYNFLMKYKEGKRSISASGYDHDHFYADKLEENINALSQVKDDADRTLSAKRKQFSFAAICAFLISLALFISAIINVSIEIKNTLTLFLVLGGLALGLSILLLVLRGKCKVNIESFSSFRNYVKIWNGLKDEIENNAFRDIELKEIYEEKRSQADNSHTNSIAEHSDTPKKPKTKVIVIVAVVLLCVIGGIVGGVYYANSYLPSKKYNDAIVLMNEGKYEEAISVFSELGKYKDSRSLLAQCHQFIANEADQNEEEYTSAVEMMNKGEYLEAANAFEILGDYKDSKYLMASSIATIYLNGMGTTDNEAESATSIALILESYEDYETAAMVYNKIGDSHSLYKASVLFYEAAEKHYAEGNYDLALANYKKVDTSISDLVTSDKILDCEYNLGYNAYMENDCSGALENLQNATEPGDIITFGSYEQDNNLSNGAEPIEWVVLERNNEYVKVISKDILDSVPFHKYSEDVQWKDSYIHEWLNNDFYNTAFSAEEKEQIITTGEIVDHSIMKLWSDVVLLNLKDILAYYGGEAYYNEYEEYYKSSKLIAEATPYALANGCDEGSWWLEDIGQSQWGYSAVAVRNDGTVSDMGIQTDFCGVRPVIEISR
ncbi:MAG: toll/interleukin-1 receptor domain-containing protein [Oscillospiraceae bacterium]|nr:toll/interleukin-1 receptor domain-containing protein [Oscillospiraceae bacterium]